MTFQYGHIRDVWWTGQHSPTHFYDGVWPYAITQHKNILQYLL